jgi:hypothetical protein
MHARITLLCTNLPAYKHACMRCMSLQNTCVAVHVLLLLMRANSVDEQNKFMYVQGRL